MAIGDQTFDNDYSFLNLPGQVQEVINPINVNQRQFRPKKFFKII